MTRAELKEIIEKVINKVQKDKSQAPAPACVFYDQPCDVTTKYGVNEEA